MRNVHSAVAARAVGAASGARSARATRTRTAPMEADRIDADDEAGVISIWRRGFRGPQQLLRGDEGVERDVDPREGFLAALLPAHDRADLRDRRPRRAHPLDRFREGPARRHDALAERKPVPALRGPSE